MCMTETGAGPPQVDRLLRGTRSGSGAIGLLLLVPIPSANSAGADDIGQCIHRIELLTVVSQAETPTESPHVELNKRWLDLPVPLGGEKHARDRRRTRYG